ncbi:hypothetical protein KA093_01480 [Candidatus Saccharibacteria bacterium]|nr:hypothetical protein [Candidatus Saccharibacteria bacterium]
MSNYHNQTPTQGFDEEGARENRISHAKEAYMLGSGLVMLLLCILVSVIAPSALFIVSPLLAIVFVIGLLIAKPIIERRYQ